MSKTNSNNNKRISNLTPNNQKWLNEYINELNEQNKSQDTISNYTNASINFVEFCGYVDLDKVSLEKVKEFLELSNSQNRYNGKLYAIRGLFEIASKYVPLSFDIKEISSFIIPRKEIEKTARKTLPLTIDEIIKIRYELRDDYNRAYVFEMLYQYGLTLDEMVLCIDRNYNENTKTFHLTSGKIIHINSIIQNIIEKRSKVLNPETKYGYKKRNAYQNNISEIGEKIGRQLTWFDIRDTRLIYFFKCHVCNGIYEAIPENWALQQFEDDIYKIKWITCRSCAMRNIKNE